MPDVTSAWHQLHSSWDVDNNIKFCSRCSQLPYKLTYGAQNTQKHLESLIAMSSSTVRVLFFLTFSETGCHVTGGFKRAGWTHRLWPKSVRAGQPLTPVLMLQQLLKSGRWCKSLWIFSLECQKEIYETCQDEQHVGMRKLAGVLAILSISSLTNSIL